MFQVGVVDRLAPMSPTSVANDLQEMFSAFSIDDGVYQQVLANLCAEDIARLRFFPAFMVQRGLSFTELGNHIPSRRERAQLLLPEGKQRAAASSKFGFDHVLPPGLGKSRHVEEATQLASPFVVKPPSDPDLVFAAYAMAVFGPLLQQFRDKQRAALLRCQRALRPLELALVEHRCLSATKVAATRKPAMFAFLTCTQQWPDR